MDIDFTLITAKTFDEAVESVISATEKERFRVLHIHNVQETLKKKGFMVESLKIIEICSAGNAHKAIKTDIRLAFFLPCKINVYRKGENTYISGMRPLMIKELFPDLQLGNFIDAIDEIIRKIVQNAAG